MREERRRRSWVAGAWLVCQLSALAAVAITGVWPVTVAHGQVCICPPGADHGDACPMHHAPKKAGECVLKSASNPNEPVLLSLTTTLGMTPPVQTLDIPVVRERLVMPAVARSSSHPVRPESPPPRA